MFAFGWILQYANIIAMGLGMTMVLSIAGSAGGVALGVASNRARLAGHKAISLPIDAFVEFVRNTPFIIQLFFVFFGLPSLGIRLTPMSSAILAIILNVGAYCAEIIRAGLDATPRGQIEAALSLGMSRSETFWRIQLLPAFQRIWPALSSQLVLAMLGSAVVSQIAVEDLSYAADFIESRTFRSFETYFFLTGVYFLLAWVYRSLLTRLGSRIFPRGVGT